MMCAPCFPAFVEVIASSGTEGDQQQEKMKEGNCLISRERKEKVIINQLPGKARNIESKGHD